MRSGLVYVYISCQVNEVIQLCLCFLSPQTSHMLCHITPKDKVTACLFSSFFGYRCLKMSWKA